ncbi:glycosyltransferase family 2 protein, partial [Streptomyces vinaceus]
MHHASAPDITVIIAVYNAMPYLNECLDSALGQSLGAERLEVIAVDDGSTDGSGAELDRYAARHPQLRVVHQPNSGGPGGPRNRALDLARGRYLFVLDADDYLGPEALERLLDMAEAQGSDVVLAKQVGLGRTVSDKAHRHAEEADLHTSEVYRSLHSAKLMRRQVIEDARLRYPEDLWYGEDQIFVTEVFLAAGKISVVGDYDCYFLRRREDGQNITSRQRTAGETVAHIERVMALVADRVQD